MLHERLWRSAEPQQSCLGIGLEQKYNSYFTEHYLPSWVLRLSDSRPLIYTFL